MNGLELWNIGKDVSDLLKAGFALKDIRSDMMENYNLSVDYFNLAKRIYKKWEVEYLVNIEQITLVKNLTPYSKEFIKKALEDTNYFDGVPSNLQPKAIEAYRKTGNIDDFVTIRSASRSDPNLYQYENCKLFVSSLIKINCKDYRKLYREYLKAVKERKPIKHINYYMTEIEEFFDSPEFERLNFSNLRGAFILEKQKERVLNNVEEDEEENEDGLI